MIVSCEKSPGNHLMSNIKLESLYKYYMKLYTYEILSNVLYIKFCTNISIISHESLLKHNLLKE